MTFNELKTEKIEFSTNDYDLCKKHFMEIYSLTENQFEILWSSGQLHNYQNTKIIVENNEIQLMVNGNIYDKQIILDINESIKEIESDVIFFSTNDYDTCKKYFMQTYELTDVQFDVLFYKYFDDEQPQKLMFFDNYIWNTNNSKPLKIQLLEIMKIKDCEDPLIYFQNTCSDKYAKYINNKKEKEKEKDNDMREMKDIIRKQQLQINEIMKKVKMV